MTCESTTAADIAFIRNLAIYLVFTALIVVVALIPGIVLTRQEPRVSL